MENTSIPPKPQGEFNPLVSVTDDAIAQPSRTLPAIQIIDWLRTGTHRPQVATIRKNYAHVLTETGDPKAAKKAIDADKKKLPGIMFSGIFRARGDKNLETYSQILCADVDGLTAERVGIVYDQLASDPHCLTVSVSPSGFGVKALCRTTGNADQHGQSVAAMAKHFQDAYGIEIDPACKNLERLCFAPDNASDWNFAAIPFDPLPIEPKAERVKTLAAPSAVQPSIRIQIAEKILGAIQRTDEGDFCECPGKHLHTTPNAAKDCKVMLDGAPTIKCFHASCAGIVDGVNYELRSQIGKAEKPTAPGSNRSDIAREYLGEESESEQADLPPMVDAADFLATPQEMPPELVAGVLHKGSKLAFGGSSKAFKTWCLLDLAFSVAHGALWLGFKTTPGKVLYVNFEIQNYAWQRRIAAVARAKGIELKPGATPVLLFG